MDRATTPSANRPTVLLGAGPRPTARHGALMSSVAGAVLLGLGVPAWAADCTSSGQTTFSTDAGNKELCLSPDGNAATTTNPYAIAIGSGTQAATSPNSQDIIDFRRNGVIIPPNASSSASDFVSGTAIGQNTVVGRSGGVGIGYNNAAGTDAFMGVAVGANNDASGGYSVAIGQGNVATNVSGVSLGTANKATGNVAVAIGRQNYAYGDQSIAQGFIASAYGNNAIALGNAAVAGVAASTTTAVNDVAIGNGARATGGSSIAFGSGAAATSASALAIGAGAVANGGKAVSIGAGNIATGNGAVAIGDPSNAVGTGAFAGGADNNVYGEGAVGIGNTNAVNASASPASGTVALGDGDRAAGQGSVALGFQSTATGAGSLAFGDTALANHAGGVALGSGAVDGAANRTMGSYTLATPGPVSLGYDNRSGVNAGTVSVGSGAGANAYRQVQNVADGSAAHDAVTMQQLASVASQANGAIAPLQAASRLAVQYGADANGDPINAVDLTKGGRLGTVAVTGLAPATTATGAVALGQMPLQYSTANSPAVANPGTASNDTALVGAQPGTVALHNLGPGSLASTSTDAVNGSQLYAAGHSAASIFGGGATYGTTTGQISAPTYTIRGASYHDVGTALDAVDTTLGTVTGAFSSDNSAAAPNVSATGANAAAGGFGASATGARSAVLGNSATDNGNAESTVLGMRASIAPNTPGSNVALGQGAVARSGALSGYSAFGLQGAQSAIGEVSVGSDNGTRRITNLAAGRDATDAVTVAQLQGAASNLGTSTMAALGGGAQYSPATGQISPPSYTIGGRSYTGVQDTFGAVDASLTALQTSAGAFASENTAGAPKATATGHSALAGGFGSAATGDGSAVLGNAATDNGVAKSTVLGMGASVAPATSGSNVALGQGAVADTGALSGYTAFGLRPTQNAIGEVSVGSAGGARRITNVAAGRDATDAVDVAQLQGAVAALPAQYATAANPTTAHPGVASQDVTLVGAASGAVSLHNIAAGLLSAGSTDAVNGSQLYAGGRTVASAFGGGASYDGATGALHAPAYVIGNTSYDNVGAALGAIDGSVSGGAGIKYFHAHSVLADSDASGADALAAGPLALASGTDATALGTRASSTGANSVALGAGSTDGGQDDVVAVGAVGAERRIVNVAPGRLAQGSTDAATAGQLFASGASIASILGGGAAYDPATGRVTPST
jgi:autotransporter adhesin